MSDVQVWWPSRARPGTFRQVPSIIVPSEPGGKLDPEALLTTADVAELYGVTTRRVQAMIASDRLRAIRYGHIWLVRAQDAYLHMDRRPGRPPTVMKRESVYPDNDYYYNYYDDDDY